MSATEIFGYIGIGLCLGGVIASFVGPWPSDFFVALGAAVVGTVMLFERLDVRHVAAALICYVLALLVIAISARTVRAQRKSGP